MSFADLMTDTVDLLKKDRSKVEGLKASVQRNKIFMDAGKLVVESGDLILRRMSNFPLALSRSQKLNFRAVV